jgi:hypothetical protein
MLTTLPWKDVLERMEHTLAEVEAAAAAREQELTAAPPEAPLAPDSSWQERLLAWNRRLANLPSAAEEAERQCREAAALLQQHEDRVRAWLTAMRAVQERFAEWDRRFAPR